MTSKTALVTGSTGFVGSCVCRELVRAGYTVKALHRAISDLSSLEGVNVARVQGDVTDVQSLLSAMEGVGTVFHIAALFRQAKFPDEVYRQTNVEGTVNVLTAAKQSGVERVVHCSTVGVHGDIPSPPAAEDEAYRPGDVYQVTKAEGEQIALEWFRSGKISGVVIRPAMIWGPGDTRTFKLFKGIARRRLPLVGTGTTLVHWVMVDDLARGFRLAAETKDAAGNIYIIAGERPVTMRHLFETIANAFGVKLLPLRIPAAPLQVLGSLTERICIPFNIEPPIYRRRVDFFTKSRAFNWTKAKENLGYLPALSFEQEVGTIARWYLDKGWIGSG